MTMSLVRGMTTTNTRKRRAKKSARLLKAEQEHEAWLESMGVGKNRDALYDKYGKRKGLASIPDYKEHQGHAIALSNSISGSAAQKDRQQYTGDYIIGIATTHKSNLMPVTSRKQAVEASTMRRN